MKTFFIVLLIIPFCSLRAQQSQSDSLKYLYTQIGILKTMIGLNKAEFVNYKSKTDLKIKALEDSVNKIKPLRFDSTMNWRPGLFEDTTGVKLTMLLSPVFLQTTAISNSIRQFITMPVDSFYYSKPDIFLLTAKNAKSIR